MTSAFGAQQSSLFRRKHNSPIAAERLSLRIACPQGLLRPLTFDNHRQQAVRWRCLWANDLKLDFHARSVGRS